MFILWRMSRYRLSFIGHHLLNKLLKCKKIAIVDNLSNFDSSKGYNDRSGEITKITFYKEDIRNGSSLADIFKQEQPDCCIHLAQR